MENQHVNLSNQIDTEVFLDQNDPNWKTRIAEERRLRAEAVDRYQRAERMKTNFLLAFAAATVALIAIAILWMIS